MTRAGLLGSLAVPLAIATLAAGCGRGGPARPNLVLLVVDTLRADRLSSYGHPEPTSPELDALAARGVRFARVVAPTSWTRPSVASMLTGHHPRTIGIQQEVGHALDASFETLAEVLRGAGYRTIGATANPNLNASFQLDQGFEVYLDSTVLFPWMPAAPGTHTVAEEPLRSAEDLLRALLDLAAAGDGRPTYLQAVLMDVHEAGDTVAREPELETLFPDAPDAEYLQAVRHVSRVLGRFVHDLGALPGWEDTVLAVVSDHGEGLGDHPNLQRQSAQVAHIARHHGWLLYESHILVPWILFDTRGRLPSGVVVERPVRLLDLAPTLLDVLGVPAPAGLAGVSLRGTWDAVAPEPRLPEGFVVETHFRGAEAVGVYGGDWKYIEHRKPIPGTDARELQAMGGPDDGARSNALAEQPASARALAGFLRLWEARTPHGTPSLASDALDEATRSQLRALGYDGG